MVVKYKEISVRMGVNAFFSIFFIAGFALCVCMTVSALAQEDIAGPDGPAVENGTKEQSGKKRPSTGYAFFDEATVKGGVYSIYRNRVRYDVEARGYKPNLDHLSTQLGAEFNSGYAGGVAGVELGGYATADLRQRAAVDHEMNFFPWSTPYKPDWSKRSTDNGFSFYKAHVKLKTDPLWAKAGYFQPSGPGVLGVNWSFFPGTYRGAEMGGKWGGLEVAVAVADEYKAPWFLEPYGFRKKDVHTKVPWLGSMGARYAFAHGLTAELAYGASKDFLHNAHFKLDQTVALQAGTLRLGYHLYGMADSSDREEDPNDVFDGTALQHYLYARYDQGMWGFRLEGTATRARQSHEGQQGYFAYRLTVPSGSSKGAYDVWWDARSDWNADEEKAVFAGVSRKLDDLLRLSGVTVGLGYAFGFDGRAYGTEQRFKESAWTAEAAYTHEGEGWLKGAWVKAHYTHYDNRTDLPSWTPYNNAFQDERDFKLLVGIPFDL